MKCRGFSSTTRWSLAIIVLMEIIAGNAFAAGPTESVIYRFQEGFDGGQPLGWLDCRQIRKPLWDDRQRRRLRLWHRLSTDSTHHIDRLLDLDRAVCLPGRQRWGVPIFRPNCGQRG